MSTTTSQTPDLDEKKQTNTQKATQKMDVRGFIISLISLLIFVLVYFSLSGFNLYLSKLAQANILPTDIGCAPYTEMAAAVTQVVSNIFGTTVEGVPLSMKMQFAGLGPTQKHSLIDILRKTPRQHFLANYLVSIMERLLSFNYSAINVYFNGLNSLPETAVVLVSPVLTAMYFMLVLFIELIYFIFIWFSCMGAFFRGVDGDKIELIGDPINYVIACGFCMLFMVILFLLVAAVPLINVGVLVACLVTTVGYVAHFMGSDGGTPLKKTGVGDIIKDVFRYYRGTIGTVFSLFFISKAFSYLGNVAGIISVVVAILMAWGKLGIPFYKATPPDLRYLSKLVEAHQAERTCAGGTEGATKHNVGILQSLFGSPDQNKQNGGGQKVPILDKRFLKSLGARV